VARGGEFRRCKVQRDDPHRLTFIGGSTVAKKKAAKKKKTAKKKKK